jgi:hypothetical protein
MAFKFQAGRMMAGIGLVKNFEPHRAILRTHL